MTNESKNEPKLITLALCDQVITDENGKHSLIGIFGDIFATQFPAVHGHMVVFLMFLNNGVQKSSKLDIQILDDNSNPLNSRIRDHIISFDKDKVGTFGIFNFNNILFTKEGKYIIKVDLDGKNIGKLPLNVMNPPN